MSPLGFKARVGSALFAIFAEANVMYIPQDSPLVLHLPTSWRPARSRSLPHMHVQRWDLARFRTCDRTNRRRTRYHCASDPAHLQKLFLNEMSLGAHVLNKMSHDKSRIFFCRILFLDEYLGETTPRTLPPPIDPLVEGKC